MRELRPSRASQQDSAPWHTGHSSSAFSDLKFKPKIGNDAWSWPGQNFKVLEPVMTEPENGRQFSGGGESEEEQSSESEMCPEFEPLAVDPIMMELENLSHNSCTRESQQDSPGFLRADGPSLSNCVQDDDLAPEPDPEMLLQPETRPISHDQLVVEVKGMFSPQMLSSPLLQILIKYKGIYAGLVMVENKCIDVDTRNSADDSKLSNDQWASLIALHKQLLHEHHDFFLASQHPSASPALSRLAMKYSMPARMWKRGIQSFLDTLNRRAPGSLHHMRAFLTETYSGLSQLVGSVPSMKDEWEQMMKALDEYYTMLGDLSCQSAKAFGKHPACGSCFPISPFSESCSKSCHTMGSDLPRESLEIEFGDWYIHNIDSTSPLERMYAYLGSHIDQLQLPDSVTDTLAGWLYYGQSIASDSFNIYSKVFMTLSLAATGYAKWMTPIFGNS